MQAKWDFKRLAKDERELQSFQAPQRQNLKLKLNVNLK